METRKEEFVLEEWAEIFLDRRLSETTNWKLEIDDNNDDISSKEGEIRVLVERNRELQLLVKLYSRMTAKSLKREAFTQAKELLCMVPNVFKSVDVGREFLVARTYPVEIEWRDRKRNLGEYEIRIFMDDKRVRILNASNNSVEGYPHPHVDASGAPCFGNIHKVVCKLLANLDYCNLLMLINRFLFSYNDDNPYIKIGKWDPDYEEDDDDELDYDSCYDRASCHDCATCSDNMCPYYSERYFNCHERSERSECLNCTNDCPYRESAMEDCREEASVADCMRDCSNSYCIYYREVEECRQLSEMGEACKECEIRWCGYNSNQETTEEIKDENVG